MPTSSITEATSLSLSISSEVWEKVVGFSSDPFQEDDRLENLIVVTILMFRSTGSDRKSINFGLYCFPTDDSSNVSLMTPLRLTLEDDHPLITTLHISRLPQHPLFPVPGDSRLEALYPVSSSWGYVYEQKQRSLSESH